MLATPTACASAFACNLNSEYCPHSNGKTYEGNFQKHEFSDEDTFYADMNERNYSDYGTKWVAYKNKESICPHDKVCIFPECENQNYCPLALAETISLKEFIKEFEEIIKEEDVEIIPPYMKAIIRSHLKEYAKKKGVRYE